MDVEREQDRIMKVVYKLPQGYNWAELVTTYGTILDNFAKICYKRLLPMIGDGTKEVEASDPIPKDKEGIYISIVLASSFQEFMLLTGLKAFDIGPTDEKIKKPKFLRFCKVNNVPEHLIEPGWKEYLED